MPAVTDYAALNAHERGGKSKVREKRFNGSALGRRREKRSIEFLLALALLQEQMIAPGAPHSQTTGSGTTDPLFGTAVGLELRHD